MSASRRRGAGFPLPLDRVATQPTSSRTTLLRPQRPLDEAQRDARAKSAPSGVGLDSASVRSHMVARLREDGVTHAGLLAAMQAVPRHEFLDTALAALAYEDTSLPIGHGQTISKPTVVARMIELLLQGQAARERGGLGLVLEVGTGCGYQCALLALLGRSVVSIERVRPLFDKAREHLALMRLDRVRLIHGDGAAGHSPQAPYQSIIAAAAVGDELPSAWLQQLDIGGRLVAPVQSNGRQMLAVVDRDASGYKRVQYEEVRFVPLKSGLI